MGHGDVCLRYNAVMLRVLIIGAGDVAKRILPLLVARCQIFAVLRNPEHAEWWRDHGARPVLADLDNAASRRRLCGLLRVAHWVIYLAPPAERSGRDADVDVRLRRLLTLAGPQQGGRSLPQRWAYISTTGVYGDLKGEWANETQACHPKTARGQRRCDAEQRLRAFGKHPARSISVLRVPGIYASDRLPLARIKAGVATLKDEDDVYTNHIHADDLADIVVAALRYGKSNRVYHAVDDSDLRMGAYFDVVADTFSLPRPRRISRQEAMTEISPALLSFMSESRRLTNHRMKDELKVRLKYPTVHDGLREARQLSSLP